MGLFGQPNLKYKSVRPRMPNPQKKPNLTVAQKLYVRANNFDSMTEEMLTKKAIQSNMDAGGRQIGEIFCISHTIGDYPTDLVHVLILDTVSPHFRFFPSQVLAEGFRMLHDIEAPK